MALQAGEEASAVALLAQRLQALFDGNRQLYYTYKQETPDNRGKLKPVDEKGKRGCDQYRGRAPSVPIWQNHILGSIRQLPIGLGIIASNDANQARWGCVDVDIYPVDTNLIQAKLDDLKIKGVCLPSKSGGCHVYFFLDTFMACSGIRQTLNAVKKRLVREMGFDTNKIDIFPQHDSVDWAAGGVSSCLFMPRLLTVEDWTSFTDRAEAAVSPLRDILADAASHKLSPNAVKDYAHRKLDEHAELVRNAPDGTKSNVLFGSARYIFRFIRANLLDNDEAVNAIRSAAEDNGWTQPELNEKLRDINRRGGNDPPPPLPNGGGGPAVSVVKFKRDPMDCSVAMDDGETEYKVGADGRPKVKLPELFKLESFRLIFAAQNNGVLWPFQNRPAWWQTVLGGATIEERPFDMTAEGDEAPERRFMETLKRWLATTRGDSLNAIPSGTAFWDQDANRYLFQIGDLMKHISSEKLRFINSDDPTKWVCGQLRRLGGISANDDGKLCKPWINRVRYRLWCVSTDVLDKEDGPPDDGPIDIPRAKKSPI